MIEFLIINNLYKKYKIKENFNNKINIYYNKNFITALIIAIIIAIFTSIIAFKCNNYNNIILKIIYSLFAFFFSGIYLIYYFIRYIIFNKKCY